MIHEGQFRSRCRSRLNGCSVGNQEGKRIVPGAVQNVEDGAEEDIGTEFYCVAVDHYNTGHPHTHIIVRGKDDRSEDLIIARDYISHGLRERASELIDLDLGPRADGAIQQRLRAEVDQEPIVFSGNRLHSRGAACLECVNDLGMLLPGEVIAQEK